MKTILRYGWVLCATLLLGACALTESNAPTNGDTHTTLGSLPAQFQGKLPCADCAGIHYELNLYPDHAYALQTSYLGQGEQTPGHFEMGQWHINGNGDKLKLVSANHDEHSLWRIVDTDTLTQLDAEGNKPASGLSYTLHRTGRPASASLEDTYWRLIRLNGNPVNHKDFTREPHLVLHADSKRISGATGCNLLLGQYSHDSDHLRFSKLGSTRMACPGSAMQTEADLSQALGAIRSYRILADHLAVYDAQGKPLALFRAIAMD